MRKIHTIYRSLLFVKCNTDQYVGILCALFVTLLQPLFSHASSSSGRWECCYTLHVMHVPAKPGSMFTKLYIFKIGVYCFTVVRPSVFLHRLNVKTKHFPLTLKPFQTSPVFFCVYCIILLKTLWEK